MILPISETVPVSEERPVLEMDELWSYAGKKSDQVWIWPAPERQTRRTAGAAFGDRSSETCRNLWESLPADYRNRAVCCTDLRESRSSVLPPKRHRASGKGAGRLRTLNVSAALRQRCPNPVRKTLSFSRGDDFHEIRIRSFIDHYNSGLSA